MNLRPLKTFLAVARFGSFAAASQNIGLTLAAISIQMKSLEEQMKVALFDRSARKVVLTRAGRLLVPRATELLRLYENIAQNLDERQLGGTLAVGAIPPTFSGLLPDALLHLRESHPGVTVHVSTGVSSELMYKVESGELDLAIVGEPPHRLHGGLVWHKVSDEPLVLLVPAAGHAKQSLSDVLTDHAFISITRTSWTGQLIHHLLRRYRLRVRESMELDSIEAITGMVARGFGVSILPLAPAGWNLDDRVSVMPLARPKVARKIGVLYKTGNERQSLIAAMQDSLLSIQPDVVVHRPTIALGRPGRPGASR
ncbi:MAG: LysR family transcriptional regulator [Candidimonas sp.]